MQGDDKKMYRSETLIGNFIRDGFCEFPQLLNTPQVKALSSAIRKSHPLDQSLFLSEQEWKSGTKSHVRTTPGPGYNFSEKIE